MNKLKNTSVLIFFGLLLFSFQTFAQELGDAPTDDLGDVSDSFQENFFEALKQRAIENYELALDALHKAEKAAKEDPANVAAVNFQIAKNLVSMKRLEDAETYFELVLKSQGDRLDVMEALYDLYYQQKNYQKAIPLVKRLIKKDEDYKEDLANLYHKTKQYDDALMLLDELDESWGETTYRNVLRRQIYKITGNSEGAISNLEEKIEKNPKNEQDYLNLIFLYSEQGAVEKAFTTAKELLKSNPKSELVHFALYKFYLDEGNTKEAIASMNTVFASSKVSKENQYKVLGDFLQFVNANPSFEQDLEKTIALLSDSDNGQVYEKVGDYYVSKERKADALKFYEKGIKNDPDNFSLLKNTLLLQIDFQKYTEAISLSKEGIEIFPSQPLLYLANGVANIALQNSNDAIDSLETGLDYILENPIMEKDYYEQLQIAYTQKGDTKNAAKYAKRAATIQL